ncbi:hypothetical protein PR048_013076 [Dryococelus australis]|uniref:DUF659 domain-containing protein n=1 Tax=Dryococelus australis TaxID=614101 RepID=A0ABQ9HR65_9NEOP|nr:hypothetical protein PR048_013076 [Dryococelus australis]
MTLIVHFIDSSTALKSGVIETTQLTEIITEDWRISQKIVCIVNDGSTKIKAAVNWFGYSHFPCIAHKLNLIVTDTIGKLLFTEANTDEIIKYPSSLNKGELKLKPDVCTRRNSAVLMMERKLLVRDANKWQIIDDCVPILKLVGLITVELSGEKYPTLSKNKNAETCKGQLLKEHLNEGLHMRLGNFEKIKMSAIATLLDPRFKTIGFGLHLNATAAQEDKFIPSAANKHPPYSSNKTAQTKLALAQTVNCGNLLLLDYQIFKRRRHQQVIRLLF